MTEETQPISLADRALQRLRGLAAGNGMEPAAVRVIEAQEQVFTLNGSIEVSPLCENSSITYPGGIRGKGRRPSRDAGDLQAAVADYSRAFHENPDWVAEVAAEIKTHDSQGWGLENARITLPKKTAIFAATAICPSCAGRQMLTCAQCNGQGSVICTNCGGQGREPCYHCGGRGENPQQPGQRCATCNGSRFAPCRFCQSSGHLPCPTCHGKRGTPCQTCQGSGKLTQEITVTCGAETHFKVNNAPDLPSGLRRGLERIGIAKLGTGGHADIAAMPPADADGAAKTGKPTFPILAYKVTIPYAELRMEFGGKKGVVSVIGKRCAIMGAPNFLDNSLQPWRERLRLAAQGKARLETAMEGRAIRELVALTVAGKGRIEEARRLYPFGLSGEAMGAMLGDLRLALNIATWRTRSIIAGMCVAGCAGLFYALFMTGRLAEAIVHWPVWAGAAATVAALLAALAASWAALNFSTRLVLQKRFPQLAVALQQTIGKTGYSMLGGIVAAFVGMIWLAPVKPLWLAMMLR